VKTLNLEVNGLLGRDKAVVSAGGVSLEEIDFRSMESKIVPGLYLVGDVLNINRPSGGYSLQLCWSTGVVAGVHAAGASRDEQNEA
jgi:predicted flavoprotein YhiN